MVKISAARVSIYIAIGTLLIALTAGYFTVKYMGTTEHFDEKSPDYQLRSKVFDVVDEQLKLRGGDKTKLSDTIDKIIADLVCTPDGSNKKTCHPEVHELTSEDLKSIILSRMDSNDGPANYVPSKKETFLENSEVASKLDDVMVALQALKAELVSSYIKPALTPPEATNSTVPAPTPPTPAEPPITTPPPEPPISNTAPITTMPPKVEGFDNFGHWSMV